MIPAFLSAHSDLPLWEQVHNCYSHGGGWNDFHGFTPSQVDGKYILSYAGDPDMHERGRIVIGDEMLVLFPASFVLWLKGDEHKVARID
jgi:hypothetical protein